jgi:hypothetical protein
MLRPKLNTTLDAWAVDANVVTEITIIRPAKLFLTINLLFGRMIQSPALCGKKKAGAEYPLDSSATRLSRGDPVGFPSHPCGWFSIIVYLRLNFFFKFQRSFRFLTCPHMLNLRLICLFDHMACNSIISHPYIHARVHVHTHGCAHVRAHIHSSRNHHNREGRPRILSALTPLISPQAIFFS